MFLVSRPRRMHGRRTTAIDDPGRLEFVMCLNSAQRLNGSTSSLWWRLLETHGTLLRPGVPISPPPQNRCGLRHRTAELMSVRTTRQSVLVAVENVQNDGTGLPAAKLTADSESENPTSYSRSMLTTAEMNSINSSCPMFCLDNFS